MIRNKPHLSVVCDGDPCSMQIYKMPDIHTKQENHKRDSKAKKEEWDHRHDDVVNKKQYKYGIFHKKGYVLRAYFRTKEEADIALSERFNDGNYCVREILDW